MPRFHKAAYATLPFKFILFIRLNNSLSRFNVPLFLELTNIVSVLFYNFIEFIILLYTFLVIYFSSYKENMDI